MNKLFFHSKPLSLREKKVSDILLVLRDSVTNLFFDYLCLIEEKKLDNTKIVSDI